jgi:mono/diheme cytochrome c family protein
MRWCLRLGRAGAQRAALSAAMLLAVLAAGSAAAEDALIEQGRYLAAAGDCVSCHTRADGKPFSGGVALDTPFGVLYSANITPDLETGIGTWSEPQFARALREGIAADGRHLYPAFPYPAYTRVSDSDVRAIYAFLQSLKPVRFSPPQNVMRFPFGWRPLLAGWNLMFLKAGPYQADASRSAEWNRGAYLTQGLGHCGACHTPRNFLGGERGSLALSGGLYLDEIVDEVAEGKVTPLDDRTVRSWSTANLTPAPDGLRAWSIEEVASYLKTGHNARAAAFGPMNKVVVNSTSRLTDKDLHAIAVYLKELPPIARSAPAAPDDERRRAGEIVYNTRCGDCHLPSGLGMPRIANVDASKTAPPLAGSAVLQAASPATLINVILYGAHEDNTGEGAWPKMNGFELSVGLNDAQIAALCTCLRSSWGNRAGPVDAAEVAQQHGTKSGQRGEADEKRMDGDGAAGRACGRGASQCGIGVRQLLWGALPSRPRDRHPNELLRARALLGRDVDTSSYRHDQRRRLGLDG